MWDDLDIQQKSELMRLFIKNNIYSLDKMKEIYNDTTERQYSSGGQIHIEPSKRGTFKAQASRMGMTVQEAASHILANKGNYSPAMVKKANFARNFAHADGGNLFFTGGPFATDPPTQLTYTPKYQPVYSTDYSKPIVASNPSDNTRVVQQPKTTPEQYQANVIARKEALLKKERKQKDDLLRKQPVLNEITDYEQAVRDKINTQRQLEAEMDARDPVRLSRGWGDIGLYPSVELVSDLANDYYDIFNGDKDFSWLTAGKTALAAPIVFSGFGVNPTTTAKDILGAGKMVYNTGKKAANVGKMVKQANNASKKVNNNISKIIINKGIPNERYVNEIYNDIEDIKDITDKTQINDIANIANLMLLYRNGKYQDITTNLAQKPIWQFSLKPNSNARLAGYNNPISLSKDIFNYNAYLGIPKSNKYSPFPTSSDFYKNQRVYDFPHIMIADDVDEALTLSHEFEHYLNGKLSKSKENLLEKIYTDNGSSIFTVPFLKKFYPDRFYFAQKKGIGEIKKEAQRTAINEFQADNASIRYQIAKKYNAKTLEEIDRAIDDISDEDLLRMLNNQSAYMRYLLEYKRNAGQFKNAEDIVNFVDEIKKALKNIAGISIPIGIGTMLDNNK